MRRKSVRCKAEQTSLSLRQQWWCTQRSFTIAASTTTGTINKTTTTTMSNNNNRWWRMTIQKAPVERRGGGGGEVSGKKKEWKDVTTTADEHHNSSTILPSCSTVHTPPRATLPPVRFAWSISVLWPAVNPCTGPDHLGNAGAGGSSVASPGRLSPRRIYACKLVQCALFSLSRSSC